MDRGAASNEQKKQLDDTPNRSATHAAICALLLGAAVSVGATAEEIPARSIEEIRAETEALEQKLQENRSLLEQLEGVQAESVPVDAGTAESLPSPDQNDVAQERTLDRVVVRASSRRQVLSEVPQSSSVVEGAELSRELAHDLGAITRRSASIQFNQNNTRGASLSIRGLGKRSFTETQDPSVGLIVDEVSYGLTQLGNFDFYDVESVEVTRGPRGTEGGKGASTGVVTVQTKKPSFDPDADFQLVFGQRDSVIVKANAGGPLIDDLLAWRGSFIADRGRGYYESDYDPNYSFYNRNRLGGRAQLLFTPTEDLDVRLSADLEPKAPQVENGLTFRHDQPYRYANGELTDASGTTAKSKLAGFTTPGGVYWGPRELLVNRTYSANGSSHPPYTYQDYVNNNLLLQNENQGQTVTNKGAAAEVNYNLDGHQLSSITAWRAYSFDAHNDEGTPLDISKNGGGGVDYRQVSQEFRLDSSIGDIADYRTGLFYMETHDVIDSKTGWGSDAGAWFATNDYYNLLYRNAGVNRGAGIALLTDSLNDAYVSQDTTVDTKSGAIFGKIDWHITDRFDLATGLRATREDRTTEDRKRLASSGTGYAFNPVSVRGVQLGGFNSAADGTLVAGGNSADQIALANGVAQKYFGVATYDALTSDQQRQVATAKSIRASANGGIGALSNGVVAEYDDTLYTALLTPSYKFNEQYLGYFSYQYGEKSGSALNVNFVNSNVAPEKTNAYELGLKATLLDGTLSINTDIYHMDIKDYQSAVRVVDEFTTASNIAAGQAVPVAYLTAQGNVDKARSRGLEIDAYYSGIPNTTLRFAGAYTDARYVSFKNAAFPDEDAYLSTREKPYTDQSGMKLPGVSDWTFNVGAEYKAPISSSFSLHTSFNTNFFSRYNNTDTLSDYGEVPSGSRTDASIGLSHLNGFDVSLIAKNLFDDRKHEEGWTSYTPYAYPRWIGLSLSGKL